MFRIGDSDKLVVVGGFFPYNVMGLKVKKLEPEAS